MSSLTPGNPGDPGSTDDIARDAVPSDGDQPLILDTSSFAEMAYVEADPPPAGAMRSQASPGRVALLVLNVALLVACASLTALNSMYPARHKQPSRTPATSSTSTTTPGSQGGSSGGFELPNTPTPSPAPTVTSTATAAPSGPVPTPTSAAPTVTPAQVATPTASDLSG
ncbi:MAG TPA: hypothetical protein VJN88_00815 [Ktedonobacterales bacterium]|nr:hypothetical protein [Ktedonobacterales bacterium]